MEDIAGYHKNIELLFNEKFIEKNSDDEEIKFLIRQERNKIISKGLIAAANMKYEL